MTTKSKRNLFKLGSSSFVNHRSHNNNNNKELTISIAFLGAEGVGKTAFIVRYLTKRFLPEYSHEKGIKYTKTIATDGRYIDLEIKDISQAESGTDNDLNELVNVTSEDVFVVMYSITDSGSFGLAKRILATINERLTSNSKEMSKQRKALSTPLPTIYLIGNKSDLSHSRQVLYRDGELVSLSYKDTSFTECSVASGPDEVASIFQDIFLKSYRRKFCLRKSSIAGSMTSLTLNTSFRRNTYTNASNGAHNNNNNNNAWWRRSKNCSERMRTDRTFTM